MESTTRLVARPARPTRPVRPARHASSGAVVVGVTMLMVASCGLFPSFDSLEPTNNNRADGSSSSSSGTSGASPDGTTSSSGTSGASGNSDSSIPDDGSSSSGTSGGDGSTGGAVIKCGATETCPIPVQYCCLTADGLHCRDINDGFGGPSNCKIQNLGEGKSFLCDGEEDCQPGQTCCFNTADNGDGVNAKCSATCTGQALCQGSSGKCPTGKSCTATVSGGIKACQ